MFAVIQPNLEKSINMTIFFQNQKNYDFFYQPMISFIAIFLLWLTSIFTKNDSTVLWKYQSKYNLTQICVGVTKTTTTKTNKQTNKQTKHQDHFCFIFPVMANKHFLGLIFSRWQDTKKVQTKTKQKLITYDNNYKLCKATLYRVVQKKVYIFGYHLSSASHFLLSSFINIHKQYCL